MRGGRCLDAPRAQRTPRVHRYSRQIFAVMGRHSHLRIAMLLLMPLVTKALPGYIGGRHVNGNAFAALDASGAINAWGDSSYGGSGAPSGSGFVSIYSTYSALPRSTRRARSRRGATRVTAGAAHRAAAAL